MSHQHLARLELAATVAGAFLLHEQEPRLDRLDDRSGLLARDGLHRAVVQLDRHAVPVGGPEAVDELVGDQLLPEHHAIGADCQSVRHAAAQHSEGGHFLGNALVHGSKTYPSVNRADTPLRCRRADASFGDQ